MVVLNCVALYRNFCKPIAVKEEGRTADPAPAPNTYNLSGVHMGRNTLVTAEAAFKSRSVAFTLIL